MTDRRMRVCAFQIARRYAARRGHPIRIVFDDTLCGDLARFHLLRELRHRYPQATQEALDALIQEAFTP